MYVFALGSSHMEPKGYIRLLEHIHAAGISHVSGMQVKKLKRLTILTNTHQYVCMHGWMDACIYGYIDI